MTPRVSVLLPVRDAAGTLPACLASLAAQTLEDHELVAVDDGSREGSGERLAAAVRGVAQRAFVEVDPRKLGQRIHGTPVVPVERAAGFPDALHLAAVGQPGARERMRAAARARPRRRSRPRGRGLAGGQAGAPGAAA